jgi:hypothetical protein
LDVQPAENVRLRCVFEKRSNRGEGYKPLTGYSAMGDSQSVPIASDVGVNVVGPNLNSFALSSPAQRNISKKTRLATASKF